VDKVIHTYDELLAVDKSRLLSLFDAGRVDRQADDDGDDSDEEGRDDSDNDDENAELEKHRTASCCAHIFSLVSKGLSAVDGVTEVLSKADKIISSTRNSTLCQQRLEALQRAENDDVLCLLSPSKTRWNARVRAYSRLLRLMKYIRALHLRGCYDRRAGRVEMLDALDESVLKEVVKIMSVLDLGITSLEHNEHTLSSVAFVYSSVLKQCTLDERAALHESMLARSLREHVVTDLKARFSDVLAPEGNVALGTLLDVRYGPTLGYSKARVLDTSRAAAQWIDDLIPESAAAVPNNDSLEFLVEGGEEHRLRGQTRNALNRLLHFAMTDECTALYPLPANLTKEELNIDGTRERLQTLFGDGGKFSELKLLAQVVFALPATSTAAERAQSIAGRVCSLYRTRMSPETVESLTVVQHYLHSAGKSVKNFCQGLLAFVDKTNK
jgi:hypothetical protein